MPSSRDVGLEGERERESEAGQGGGGGAHVLAMVLIDGVPSNTTTRSARYVAMMKSCSTTNAVFLA